MSVKWKICEKCGKKVNEVAHKCPYCKSSSFKENDSFPKVSKAVKISQPSKSNIKWKCCVKCGKRMNEVAVKCPYCGSTLFKQLPVNDSKNEDNSIKNSHETSKSYDEENELKICARCGVKVNKELNKCPFCLSTSFEELQSNNSLQGDDNFTSNTNKKSLPYKWKFCRKCGINIDYHYSRCPNCNSNCLKDIESNHEIKLFTPSNKKTRVVINKHDNDAESIPEYSKGISKEHADNEIESIPEYSEDISKEHADNESAILLFLKHKLFYKKYEGKDLYIFSRLKFIIVLIFGLLFIFMVLCSFDFVTSLIWLAISIFPAYILACFEHGESEVTSELIESRKGNISDNVIHFLCYWYEEEDNIFVFAKTKAISFLIYIVVFIHQYYATNSLLFAWIIGLILYVVALFGGTIIHGALYSEKSSKEITKQEKKVNEIQKEKIVSKPKTITKKQPTNESEVLKPKVKLPLGSVAYVLGF